MLLDVGTIVGGGVRCRSINIPCSLSSVPLLLFYFPNYPSINIQLGLSSLFYLFIMADGFQQPASRAQQPKPNNEESLEDQKRTAEKLRVQCQKYFDLHRPGVTVMSYEMSQNIAENPPRYEGKIPAATFKCCHCERTVRREENSPTRC